MSRANGGCTNKTNISQKIADTGVKLLCGKSKADQHIKHPVHIFLRRLFTCTCNTHVRVGMRGVIILCMKVFLSLPGI